MKKVLNLLLAVMLLFAMGCGKKEEPVKKEEVKKEVKVADITIGNKSEDAMVFLLKNCTGRDITAMMMKTIGQDEYSVNMMAKDMVFEQGQVAQVFYIPEEAETEEETERAVNSLCQAKFVLEDGSEVELHALGIEDIDGEAELLYEDEVLYVSYKSKLIGNVVSTKEQELSAKKQQEEEYYEPDYTEPAPVAPESVQSTVVEQPQPEPAPVPEAPQQSEEGCLTDVEILNP